jgi:hypothetical protein
VHLLVGEVPLFERLRSGQLDVGGGGRGSAGVSELQRQNE